MYKSVRVCSGRLLFKLEENCKYSRDEFCEFNYLLNIWEKKIKRNKDYCFPEFTLKDRNSGRNKREKH
jgi:hypothetical protein